MASYVSYSEYLAQFGERDTTLLTRTDNAIAGPDSAKVDAELADATDLVDGYISRRYVVPIANPPRLVQGWVKNLAREALYNATGQMLQTVKDAADVARRQLADLVAGKLDIPATAIGDAPIAQISGGLAMSSNDRPSPVLSCNPRLDDFTAPFTGYRDNPRWRTNAGG